MLYMYLNKYTVQFILILKLVFDKNKVAVQKRAEKQKSVFNQSLGHTSCRLLLQDGSLATSDHPLSASITNSCSNLLCQR